MAKILIVDDEKDLRQALIDFLDSEGIAAIEARSGAGAVKILKTEHLDAILLDLKMPVMDGMEALGEIKKINPHVPVIMLTAYGDIPTAVEAIKCGAYDFTVKPPDFNQLIVTIKRAIERNKLQTEMRRANTAIDLTLEQTFGKSKAARGVIDRIKQVSGTDFSVIVQGETGTGKSFVAGAIHNMSGRAKEPFVRVDIGLIPDTLVESELFGYKRGAFTGADRDKAGYFETAHKGTIFIDEVENMSVHMQGKLLNVIERKSIYPLGSSKCTDIDVRITAATNKNITESVFKKEFREDLFYRLGEFVINLPPLRERVEDIPFFADKFFREACMELDKRINKISDDGMALLMKHAWPGNIRELKNVIRKAVLLSEGDVIAPEDIDIPIGDRRDDDSISLKGVAKEAEKEAIVKTLKLTNGNRSKAAKLLNVSYRFFLEKIKKYRID